MSYIPNIQSLTSQIGVNSYTATTGSLWTGNVFVGAGEQNDFNYVGVNLQTDESGTLTFEFSQNGTDWSSYPTQEFTVVAGINEVHGAWKGTRYVRPKFTGADGSRTYFRIRTMYSYDPIVLSAPLNQPIGSDSDANIVRAVNIGQDPTGTFVNNKSDGVGFQTTVNLASGDTFSSDVIDAQGYTQVQTHIVCDNDGTLGFKFCSTSNCSGTTVGQNGVERYLSVPYLASTGFQLYSAPAFTPYVQYTFTNGGTGTTTQLFYETKLLTKSLSGQLLGVNSFISPSMVGNLVRSVATGKQPDGDFVNAVADGTGFVTTNNLLSGQTYTSDWIDTDGFNSISLFISADVPGSIDGLTVQFTDDVQAGTPIVRQTLNYSFTQFDVDRGYLELDFVPKLDGFRVTFTNGSTDQSNFFLQSDLRVNKDNNKYTTGGALIVGDFKTEVALGLVPNNPNNFLGTKFGTVSKIDTADADVTVWALADDARSPRVDRKTFSTTADTIYISSSSASDNGIKITTIVNDSNNDLKQNETIISGQTPVSIGVSGLDCNTAFVSGDDQTLAGDVYITLGSDHTSGIPNDLTKVLAFIPQVAQRTQQATFRVPNGSKMIIDSIHCNIAVGTGNASAQLFLRVKPQGGSWYILRPYNLTTSSTIERNETIVLDEGTFVEFYMDVSANDVDMTTIFRYQLIDNLV
jgi:hypothetical protein